MILAKRLHFVGSEESTMTAKNVSNSTRTERPDVFSTEVSHVILVIYILLTLVNFVGNSIVFILVYKFKRLRTPLNVLLVNLSAADFIAGLGCYPFMFVNVSKTSLNGTAADLLCAATTGLSVFFIAAVESIFTLTGISLNRFVTIKYPLKREWRLSKRSTVIFIACSWMMAIAFMVPTILSMKYEPKSGFCTMKWPKYMNGTAYSLITSFLAGGVPIIVLFLTYVTTWRQLWREDQLGNRNAATGTLRSRKRVMFLLGGLILIFVICWIPFIVYWVLKVVVQYFDTSTVEGRIQLLQAYTIVILFAVISATLDPLVYALRADQFKTGLKQLLPCFRGTGTLLPNLNPTVLRVNEQRVSGQKSEFNLT